jgi:hypothetical protein
MAWFHTAISRTVRAMATGPFISVSHNLGGVAARRLFLHRPQAQKNSRTWETIPCVEKWNFKRKGRWRWRKGGCTPAAGGHSVCPSAAWSEFQRFSGEPAGCCASVSPPDRSKSLIETSGLNVVVEVSAILSVPLARTRRRFRRANGQGRRGKKKKKKMDELGIEPKAFRMRNGRSTTELHALE